MAKATDGAILQVSLLTSRLHFGCSVVPLPGGIVLKALLYMVGEW